MNENDDYKNMTIEELVEKILNENDRKAKNELYGRYLELAEKVLNEKDRKAYNELFPRYLNSIKFFVRQMIKKADLTDNLTQEIFVNIFKKLHAYNPSYAFSSWIYRIAVSTLIDFIKKEKNKN